MEDTRLIGAIDALEAARDKVKMLTCMFRSRDIDFNACSEGVAGVLEIVESDLADMGARLAEMHDEEGV